MGMRAGLRGRGAGAGRRHLVAVEQESVCSWVRCYSMTEVCDRL